MMAGSARKQPEEWDAEIRGQFLRFGDPKSQSRGCLPERTDRDPRSSIRAPSRRHQDNNFHGSELGNSLGDLCKEVNTDSVDSCRGECEKMGRFHRYDPYTLCRKEGSKRDATGYVAEDFIKEEYHDCAGGRGIGKKYTAGGLCDKQDNHPLGGHFFRRGERVNLPQEDLSRQSNNRNPLLSTPFADLRKASIDSRGSPKSFSHSSSRSRSTARGSNVDCPQLSHSRSVSLSSSNRWITPRGLGRRQSFAIPFGQKCASRLEDPAPEEGFKGHAINRAKFSREYAPSKSKPAKSHGPVILNSTAAGSQRSSNRIRIPGPRRITLIERYQRGLMLRKPSIRNKGSSSSRKKTRCPDLRSGGATPASGAKDCSFMHHEGYWRGKSEEGLSPLRSPWREVPETIPYEDPRRFYPCCEQTPGGFQRENCRVNPENYYSPDTRRESHHSASPRFIESFRHFDPSYNSLPAFNYCNNSKTMRASGRYSVPQTTRDTNLSPNLTHATKLRSSCDDNYVARDSCSNDDLQTTEDSYTCTHCLAAEGLSSAKDDPHPARSSSLEYENSETAKDSFSCTRPLAAKGSSNDSHLGRNFSWQQKIENPLTKKDLLRCARRPIAAKDMSSANHDTARTSWPEMNSHTRKDSLRGPRHRHGEDPLSAHNDPHSAKNFPWQKVNPQTSQDSFGYTRPHLGAKDLSSTSEDPHNSGRFLCQNELESRNREAQFDNPHEARTSWRRNDLYQVKEAFLPFSAREIFDGPVPKRDSCWYDEEGTADKERNAAQDSWWRTHPANAEMEASSSLKESQRGFWRPHLGRETASKFDESERDSWRQTSSQGAIKLASPSAEPNVERDSRRNSDSVARTQFSTNSDLPCPEPRTNFRHDRTPLIQIPCCRSEDDAFPLPVSSRHYCQPQSLSHETDVPLRVASRYPTSAQRCETRHHDGHNFTSSSRLREKERTNEMHRP